MPATLVRALASKLEGSREYLRWVTASQGDNVFLITVDDVCYFQADSKYTMVMTPAAEALIRRPIKDLEAELDPAVFWRIHRATLVNINAVAGLNRDFRGHLHVRLKHRKETLAVSEPYVHLFKQM